MVMYAVGHTTALNTDQSIRFVILAALVFVPCIIWTLFFYLQDRFEPEPLSHIISPFIAGMAAAALGSVPLHQFLFHTQDWIYASLQLFVLGSFLVKASVASAVFYIVLRYGFLPLKEFNEPVDGLFYGAVLGTGFSFVYSLDYLLGHPSFTLYVIAFTATVNVLIFSSVGALMGYILSLIKFRQKNRIAYSLLAIIVGIILLGIFYLVGELFFVSGISHAFWFCFVSVLIYSLLILICCYFKMRRLSEKGIYKGETPQFRFGLTTMLFIGFLIVAAGVISYQGMLGKEFKNAEYGMVFRYPHSLSTHALSPLSQPMMTTRVVYKILFSGKNSSPPFVFSVKVDPKKVQPKVMDSLRYVGPVRTESFLVEGIEIAGKKGQRIVYSFLEKSKVEGSRFPQLIKVYTDVIVQDNENIIFTYTADSSHFEEGLPLYNKILGSLRWQE
jgi:RsiW-degrading membrane proteinase PrsW (M82 family)